MQHPLKAMIEKRKRGIHCAVPSYCTANELVIEAVLEEALRHDDIALIEATANQVNQFGGYTGMKPPDFARMVLAIAHRIGFDEAKIILGGDHLGPLTWCRETEETAMKKAEVLVASYVKAGFTKIHLDTSMKLGDDPKEEKLPTRVIASRGARLLKVCEEAFKEVKKLNPHAVKPVYIIGSEVPIPGGSQEAEEDVTVTTVEDFEDTVETYTDVFQEYDLENAWDDIIAVVVQPGVEFSDSSICKYDRMKARELCMALKKYNSLVFEGHSTDYQSAKALREMVEDGVGILKVGPALTFALREALFALNKMEEELIDEESKCSGFIQVLEKVMLEKPDNWKKHYHGSEKYLKLARKYSFSDRCRYYLGEKEVTESIELLFHNLDMVEIPLNMLYQYMPVQHKKVRDGILKNTARSLAKDVVTSIIYDYEYASKENYEIGWS